MSKNSQKSNYLAKIKDRLFKIDQYFKIRKIWDEAKEYIMKELNSGEIIEALNIKTNKFYTCPKGMPPEYFSIENIENEFQVKTSTGNTFYIVQANYGVNFEAPPDVAEYRIYDANRELLYKKTDADEIKEEKRKNS